VNVHGADSSHTERTPAATTSAPHSIENRTLPAMAHYSASTAQRAKHKFALTTDCGKSQEAGPTPAEARRLSDSSEIQPWPSSRFEHRFVQAGESEPVRFMKGSSRNVSTPGNLYDSASVAHTAYLRLAAGRLFDRDVDDGRLQAFHLDGMIDELSNEPHWNGREDMHDALIIALRILQNDSKLQETFNSIGEGRW
jgi:hypothetical protein